MDRRRFLCTLATACGAGTLATACAPLPIFRGEVRGSAVVIPIEKLPAAGASGILVRAGSSAKVIALSQQQDGSLIAHSAICTHQGCEIRPEGQGWRCPCHGAAYDREGHVTRGPAKRDLARYTATRLDDEGLVRIDTQRGDAS